MQGIIIKNENGYFTILNKTGKLMLCRSRGNLKLKSNLLVGDVIEYSTNLGTNPIITKVYARRNTLKRPPVANIEQLVIVIAIKNPNINLYLLDKMIAISENMNITPLICINKADLSQEEAEYISDAYTNIGYKVILTTKFDNNSINLLKSNLSEKVIVFTGPSGAGKSTILNKIIGQNYFKSQEVSKYTGRGKTTTRHVELVKLDDSKYVIDTPGFTFFDVSSIFENKIDFLFKEFREFIEMCKFSDCKHISEPKCAVLNALNKGVITKERYNSYKKIIFETEEYKRGLYK